MLVVLIGLSLSITCNAFQNHAFINLSETNKTLPIEPQPMMIDPDEAYDPGSFESASHDHGPFYASFLGSDSPSPTPVPPHNDTKACGKKKYACKDCYTAQICAPGEDGRPRRIAEVPCSKERPYCNEETGTCQSEVASYECSPTNTTLSCQTDGYFPHPTDCKQYFVCYRGLGHPNSCPENSHYDPSSQTCRFGFVCSTFDCKAANGLKVVHPADFSYFAYCKEGEVIQVDKCPNKYGLNNDSQLCEPTCDTQDTYADVEDCTKYYLCGYEGYSSALTLSHISCADDSVFNPVTLGCVSKNTIQCYTVQLGSELHDPEMRPVAEPPMKPKQRY